MASRASRVGQSGARGARVMQAGDAGGASPSALGESGWPAWTGAVAVAAGMGSVALAPSVVTAVAHALGVASGARHVPAGLTVAIGVVREACLALVAVWFAWRFTRAGRAPAASRHLRPANWAGAVVAIAVLLIATLAFGGILRTVSGGPHLDSGFSQVGSTGSLPYWLDVLTVIALAPVCEELLFRGYLFTALRRRCGVPAGALITGVAWGALHLPVYSPLQCAPLAVFGVGLCLIYWRTGSLLPCMIAHGLNNATAYAAGDHFTAWQRTALLAATPVAILALMRLLSRFQTITTPGTTAHPLLTSP